jgi:putative phosphoesterase
VRIGLISDIHGNLPALEAVVASLEREALDRVICLGDICFGPQAHECLALVAGLGCPVILGNWDSWSIDGFPPADDPVGMMLYEIGAWWARQLTEDDRAYVRSFVPTLELELEDGTQMLCFHGSPHSFSDFIFATTPDTDLENLLSGLDTALLVGGHTHLQMLRRFGPSMIVNPGSVGQPFSQWWPREIRVGHWAEYGVIDASEGRVGIELRRVPYDLDRLLELLVGSGMPHARWWIDSWNASSQG